MLAKSSRKYCMPRSGGELVRAALEEVRHLGVTALDATVDVVRDVSYRTEDMPMIQAVGYYAHRMCDKVIDAIWDSTRVK